MVIEVYQPMQWFPSLSTFTTRQELVAEERCKQRYEFVGKIADADVRDLYVGKSVADLFSRGEQNPVKYIWGKDQNK